MAKILSITLIASLVIVSQAFAQQDAAIPEVPAIPQDLVGTAPVDLPDVVDPVAAPTAPSGDLIELAEPAPIDPPADAFLTQPGEGAAVDGVGDPVTGTEFDDVPALSTTGSTSGGRARDFEAEDLSTVLRLLARQAKINLVVSDAVVGTVTMRLEDVTATEAIKVVVTSKGLIMDEVDNVFYVKTAAEKAAEPTEGAFYTFSYGRAADIAALLQSQLKSGVAPQTDERTNTVFYQEVHSNLDSIKLFLETVDRPTRQVMIETRLVEVTANPRQSYGINWAGVVGGSDQAQTFRYGGSNPVEINPEDGTVSYDYEFVDGQPQLNDFIRYGATGGQNNVLDGLLDSVGLPVSAAGEAALGQFAILSVPQMSLTLRLLNEDADAEFLANPRVVTADNQEATIQIIRNQPVPQLNFNEQTATAVFGGFEDKEYGNTLIVKPSINKDDFVTLSVKPTISNKVADETFLFAGAAVSAPIIDTRSLESNVLIKSGMTLAIGGLLQDATGKATTKVPILGDIPFLGYLFQEKVNQRSKRNLLVFVTPTIINLGEGTGLEDQVNGLDYSGEEYADPTGWRNNAKGAVRIAPTSHRSLAADYPKPGAVLPPRSVGYKGSATARE